MKDGTRITQQKRRRIPIQLQDQVDSEITNLLDQGHIERVETIKDDVFIQPVVITVKKDRSVKIALDARALNDSIAKDKYQMPNLENLMDMVAEKTDGKEGQVFYPSVDMKYAYGQIPLDESTAKHCNFQIIGGKSTVTYRFVTGHYGLTKMPTDFQKVMDLTLINMDGTFVYIDDILIFTKGEKSVHMQTVREVLEVLDKANLKLKADECKIACTKIEWLGYKLSGEGVAPINGKIQGISEMLRPNNLKELRSFLGVVNQLNKFVPDLASICAPFRSILKKEAEWKWTKEHEEAFLKINQEIKSITELTHFKRNKKLRIICDASKQGLGAMLQKQQDNQEWKPVSSASRFLTNFEAKYSINELELLAVVWAIEHFRNYVYGVKFQVIPDHKALASVLRPNRGNKTFSSCLTKWVDGLLPFEFELLIAPGKVLGFADYLSRHPTKVKGTAVKAEKLWNDWFTVNTITRINVIPENETNPQDVPRERKLTRAPDSVLRVKNDQEDRQATKAKQREGKQPIKLRENKANENEHIISADNKLASVSKQRESKIMQTSASEIIDKTNQAYLPGNYEADKVLQKVIQLVKTREGSKTSRLPAPWREKFNALSVDHRNYLYMDQRLVIPANLRSSIVSSIHYGHPGRDTILRYVADIWSPKIHRELINTAKCCEQCSKEGKNAAKIY